MTEITIPLNKLVTWTGNVRKTAKLDGIDELAASIAAHGLLQSLVVRKTSRGRFAVIAGERRRQALSRLAETGKLEADHPVSCRVIEAEADATEISLTENVMRVAMHPADQFEAFRSLIDSGATIAEVAARLGTSGLTVTRRMKLGRVSPALLDLYRAGKMGLEQVQAFAMSDDHAAQERVWAEISAYYHQSPQQIRQMLTAGEIPASDKRVRFVTLDAYEAAGGTVRRDLFDDRSSGYLVDAALLDQLVAAKLAEARDTIAAEGWKWAESRIEFDWQDRQKFEQLVAEAVPLSAEDSDECDRLDAELAELTDSEPRP
jgi:ParB family chromosome partitioning protein